MFIRIWSGYDYRLEGFFGEYTCQKRKDIFMWGLLTVIAFVLVYITFFDRSERLKSMQELVRLLKLLLKLFSNR